jgi:hypothetical protein
MNDVDSNLGFPISTHGRNIVTLGFGVPTILTVVDRNKGFPISTLGANIVTVGIGSLQSLTMLTGTMGFRSVHSVQT